MPSGRMVARRLRLGEGERPSDRPERVAVSREGSVTPAVAEPRELLERRRRDGRVDVSDAVGIWETGVSTEGRGSGSSEAI
jgi:hypothetical protein